MKPLWIKWYPVQWLHSTARDEMSAGERATFQDFVCLAAISSTPGIFKFVDEESLSRMLNTDIEILKKTIKTCLERKRISIKNTPEGKLCKVLKWYIYQPITNVINNQEIQKDKVNVKTDSSSLLLSSLIFSFSSLKWEGIKEEDKTGWKEAFPACDIEAELMKMAEWLKANPEKRKKNYRKFIFNWLSRSQDRGGTQLGFIEKTKTKKSSDGPSKFDGIGKEV
jgi:hypothetical protein